MSKPKVLIVLNDFNQGGAETQAIYLAIHLKAAGYIVEVLAFGGVVGMAYDKLHSNDIVCHSTGFREKLLLPPFNGWKAHLLHLKFNRKLIQLVKKIKPSVIIPFTYAPNVIFCNGWKKMGAKKCFWNQRDQGINFTGRTSEAKALQKATHIISNSLGGKYFLEKFTQRPIEIIHNGVVLPLLGNPSFIQTEKIRLVMVAHLHDNKDHLTLLKAWLIVLHQLGTTNAQLLLAGNKGGTYLSLQQFVNENNLQDSVSILGPIKDVAQLLSTVDIGILSSNAEGLPNGILECMAVGLPVVATNIPGVAEALGSEYPFLAAPQNEEAFAEKLLQLLVSPSLRAEWGRQNLLRVTNHFSIEKMGLAYERLFEN